jgi:hypothetical protein
MSHSLDLWVTRLTYVSLLSISITFLQVLFFDDSVSPPSSFHHVKRRHWSVFLDCWIESQLRWAYVFFGTVIHLVRWAYVFTLNRVKTTSTLGLCFILNRRWAYVLPWIELQLRWTYVFFGIVIHLASSHNYVGPMFSLESSHNYVCLQECHASLWRLWIVQSTLQRRTWSIIEPFPSYSLDWCIQARLMSAAGPTTLQVEIVQSFHSDARWSIVDSLLSQNVSRHCHEHISSDLVLYWTCRWHCHDALAVTLSHYSVSLASHIVTRSRSHVASFLNAYIPWEMENPQRC